MGCRSVALRIFSESALSIRSYYNFVPEPSNETGAKVARRLKILINPFAGQKKAERMFAVCCKPLFEAARCAMDVVTTASGEDAREIGRTVPLDQFDAVVIISGDGTLHQVLNGFFEREDWEKARQMPIGVIPGGSANGLSICLQGTGRGLDPCFAALQVVKGRPMDIDLCEVEQMGRKPF
ncbi:MAG: ATP-NAD kinase-like domain-containing protein, partial [Olpidium bornovanus]